MVTGVNLQSGLKLLPETIVDFIASKTLSNQRPYMGVGIGDEAAAEIGIRWAARPQGGRCLTNRVMAMSGQHG